MADNINFSKRRLVLNQEKLILMTLFTAVGSILGRVLANNTVTSLFFAASFVLLLISFFYTLMVKGMRRSDFLLISTCLCVAFFAIMLSHPGIITFSYAKKMIMFSCTVLMLQMASVIEFSPKATRAVLCLGGLCAVLLASIYYVLGERTMMAGGLLLRFSNPNETGMFLLHGWLYCILLTFAGNSFLKRLFFIVLSAAMLYLIFLTRARACLVSAACMLCFLLISQFGKSDIIKTRWICFLVMVLPLIAIPVYKTFLTSDLTDMFTFLTGKGKTLGSRWVIWENALNVLYQNPFLGNYYEISDGLGMSQMHNTSIDVLASYGVPVFICYQIILFNTMSRIAKEINTRNQRIAICAFYVIMIQGTFEASFVSGGSGLYLLSCGFLLVARNKQ